MKPPDEKPDSVLKHIRELGDSLFLGVLGSKRVTISYSLLKYLGYDIEEFGIEITKYRTVVLE